MQKTEVALDEKRPADGTSASAVSVASDLDVVLKRLRCDMDDGDLGAPPQQLVSREWKQACVARLLPGRN